MYISLSVHSSHRHLRRDKQTHGRRFYVAPCPLSHHSPPRPRSYYPSHRTRYQTSTVHPSATAPAATSDRPTTQSPAEPPPTDAAADQTRSTLQGTINHRLSRRMPRTDLATARSRPTPSPPSSRRPSPVPCRRLPLHNPRLVPPQHDPRKCPLPLYSSAKAWSTHAGSPSLRAMPSPCPRRCSSWRASTLLSIS